MPKASKWFALPVLAVLAGRAAGDATARNLPSPSFPALTAGALIYALVPNPLGASSWAERQVEAARMGGHDRPREDLESPASLVLITLPSSSTGAYVLPAAAVAREAGPNPVTLAADARMVGAFEAIGLRPEELLEKSDTPVAALSVADAITGAIDWSFASATRLRAMMRDSGAPPLKIEEQPRFAKPDYVRFQPPAETQTPTPLIFTKRIVRSVYKVLLGVAIGILIWGMVRRSGEGRGEGEPGAFFR